MEHHGQENRGLAIDVIHLLLGAGLALRPWIFDYAGAGAWNAWIVGGLVGLIGLGTLFSLTARWILLGLGLWALLSPWLLRFSDVSEVMYVHVIFGTFVAVLAIAELLFIHEHPISTV